MKKRRSRLLALLPLLLVVAIVVGIVLLEYHHLQANGAKLDTPEETSGECSLMAAARSGDVESVRLLLAHGADAKIKGQSDSMLTAAVSGNNLAVFKLLVGAGADVNGGGAYTCVLQDAAEVGNVEIVRYLLKKGAKVDLEFRWNRTPLLEAVREGHVEVVKLLLEHGADWRPKEETGGADFVKGANALRLARRPGATSLLPRFVAFLAQKIKCE